MAKAEDFKHVSYLWDAAKASSMSPLERLVYRSNLLGSDQRITNTAGGNTSSTFTEKDPISGEALEVFWVKGSGGDLRTSKKENFASLVQRELDSLKPLYQKAPGKGAKTPVEDSMVELYRHCTFNLNPRPASIDTPLLSFVPYKHVDHLHPNAAIAIAASQDGPALVKEIFGADMDWIAFQRPGFDLGLRMQEIAEKNPRLKGLIMANHGMIHWANDDQECYETGLSLIEKAARYLAERDKGPKAFGGAKHPALDQASRDALWAELLPWLRGKISLKKKFIATVDCGPAILAFVNSADAPRLSELGTSCPDHFLRTKIKPLYVAWDPSRGDLDSLKGLLEKGLVQYRLDYEAYYEKCKRPDSPTCRDSSPTVILIPGLGLIAWGKNKSESRVTAEFYNCAVEVMRGAEAVSRYVALPAQEAFDIEYWLLEEAKLKRMPPENEFARSVAVVVGAGSGIGKASALRLAREGAHVVCVDLDQASAEATAKELIGLYGQGIGVAGTGISGCGPAIALTCDITKRDSVASMFKQVMLAYGGLDHVLVTAGIFVPPDAHGQVPDDKWDLSFAINVKGLFLVADEARKIFEAQGLRGSMVLTTSVNGVVSKKGSMAYDSSKAAANHLVRELAMELAPLVRVNGLAPATVVKGSTMFPRERVLSSLAKYKLAYDEKEGTEALRARLADFYAERTLTKSPITPEDQAEMAYFLLSKASSQTTGQIFAVDGGLAEAFLR
jgi:rhamnulose-1-phosphate aldolase/alcohol dehydrogenase